jgi:ABC-type multidrug transport system fused ATPase/permease subunit
MAAPNEPTTGQTSGRRDDTPRPPRVISGKGATGRKIRWIWNYWRPHRGFLVFLFIFTLVSSAVTIAYPMVFKVVLDKLFKAAQETGGAASIPRHTVTNVLLILAAIGFGRFVSGFYPSFRAWMNLKIDVDVREAVFARILRKDFRFFNKFSTGDLVTRLMDDISEYPKISWFSCSGIFRAVDAGSKLLFCVIAMFLLDWRLSLLSLVPLPVMLYIIYRIRSQLTEAAQNQQKAISATNDMLEKTFSGIHIVKAFCAEPGQGRALTKILEHRIDVQYRVQRLYALINTLDTVASRIGQLVVLGVGAIMAVRGDITLGTIYAFYIYLDMLVQPMWDLPNLLVTARQCFVCIDREEELIHYPVKIAHGIGGDAVSRIDTLEFDRVSFGFDETRAAVQNLSFKLRRGETVAVVGPIASGKSTILRLASGLLIPDQGVIRVNGRPLSDFSWEEYRRRVGYTPQDSLLFSESIRENVTMGRVRRSDAGEAAAARVPGPDPETEEWIRRVLAVAQMESDLSYMAEGTETVLGQKGAKVSGGQRQRISIARALYARPEILLLDDCTASLDAENEDRLWSGIRAILPEASVLLVSHRLATIRRAGRILVLDHGVLTDQGSHEELAERSEVYRRFLERAEERAMVLEGDS